MTQPTPLTKSLRSLIASLPPGRRTQLVLGLSAILPGGLRGLAMTRKWRPRSDE